MENSGAYFVGKAELLAWINQTLGLHYTKVEQTHNGAVACQMMDALHPGSVPLSRVKFNATTEYDMINNYKILQNVFNKQNLDKTIDVNKLIKGKPLDNLEFMQWLKAHFDKVTAGQGVPDYNGPARRAAKGNSGANTARSNSASNRLPAKLNTGASGKRESMSKSGGLSASVHSASPMHPSTATNGAASGAFDDGAAAKVTELEREILILQQKEAEITMERDFYFAKLREIELLCQMRGMKETYDVMQHVENVLYAATKEEGEAQRQLAQDTLRIDPSLAVSDEEE